MRQRKFFAALAIISAALAPLSAKAATYELDPSHAYIGFSVKHMMVSNVRGEFHSAKGTLKLDPADITKSSVEVEIGVNTVDTREAKRDEHLKGGDFFDAVKFPLMNFKSTSVKQAAPGKLAVTGDLTIRGITKSVTLDVAGPTPEIKDPWGKTRIGASATAKINRKDFGLAWHKVLETGGLVVGDEVDILLEVEFIKQ